MATIRAKESCGLGKERKIAAPSPLTIPNTPTKRTPKSSPRGLSTDHKLSSFPSAPSLSILPEKHVPNYLKSTASSRHDHNFKPLKKSASGGPAPIPEGKPMNRRRSFDKPPPAAPRLDKPFRSPGPRNRAAAIVPVRSSSFGAKPSTTMVSSSTKTGVLERSGSRNSRGGGKPQQPLQTSKSSGNIRKSLKRESSNAASASASASASAELVPKTKNAVEHVGQTPVFTIGVNEDELKKIECELDPYLPDPRPELAKELRTDQVEKKAVLDKEEADRKDVAEKKLRHHQPIQDTKIFKVAASNKKVEETPRAAETEISRGANAKLTIRDEENRVRNEGEGEEEAKEEEKPERSAVEKEEVVGVAASEESTNNKNEEKISTNPIQEGVIVLDHKEAEDGQSCKEEHDNSTEKEAEAEATEKVAAAAKTRQGGPGRKESPAVYNHVIEEAASKLLEKRKNKVRALAGAFQIVIDYESSSK